MGLLILKMANGFMRKNGIEGKQGNAILLMKEKSTLTVMTLHFILIDSEPVRLRKASKIFVVDTGDIFGQWIPSEWINQVIEINNKCPQHIFQYLTKNPKRLMEYEFQDNAWAGTSVNSDEDIERADILKTVKAPIRYLSIEPLLGPVTFSLDGIQWIILGAQTGKNPVIPEKLWIDNILKQAYRLNIPVFMKNNIRQFSQGFYQDYPSV